MANAAAVACTSLDCHCNIPPPDPDMGRVVSLPPIVDVERERPPIVVVREPGFSVLDGVALGLGFGLGLLAIGAAAFFVHQSQQDAT